MALWKFEKILCEVWQYAKLFEIQNFELRFMLEDGSNLKETRFNLSGCLNLYVASQRSGCLLLLRTPEKFLSFQDYS